MTCGGDVTNEKPPPNVRTLDDLYENFGLANDEHAPFVDENTAKYRRMIGEMEVELKTLEKEVKRIKSENKALEKELIEAKKEVERVERNASRSDTVNRSSRNNGDSGNDSVELIGTFEATFYTAYCPSGCTGVTATGIDVSNTIYHEGRRIIAADPSVIPLRSIVKVTLRYGQSFEAIVADTGGAIKGRKIDVLVASREEAKRYGRQTAEIEILKWGGR